MVTPDFHLVSEVEQSHVCRLPKISSSAFSGVPPWSGIQTHGLLSEYSWLGRSRIEQHASTAKPLLFSLLGISQFGFG
jgi:hypothetical protein